MQSAVQTVSHNYDAVVFTSKIFWNRQIKKPEKISRLKDFLFRNRNSKSEIKKLFDLISINLVVEYDKYFDIWFYPGLLNWNNVSVAFAFYNESYDFYKWWEPNLFHFKKRAIQELIYSRLNYFEEWIKYVKLKTLLKALPKRAAFLIQNKKYLNFSSFYNIYKNYSSCGPKYAFFILKYHDVDDQEYISKLQMINFLNNKK